MLQRMSPVLADIVAKRFFAFRRAILIQKIDPPRNIDSSGAPIGFESCALGGGRRLLQQNRHKADIRGTATFWSLLENSGHSWILGRDGLSAYDPKRTLSVRRS